MDLKFEKFTKNKSKELTLFLISEIWEYHQNSRLKKEDVEKQIVNNYYTRKDQVTFLVKLENKTIGLLRIFDLNNYEDESPLFDIRLKSSQRGKGVGEKIINFMLRFVFENYDLIRRIEGTTREDNLAMKKLFERTGFLKVAQFRKNWKDEKGIWYDTIGYDILKEEYS